LKTIKVAAPYLIHNVWDSFIFGMEVLELFVSVYGFLIFLSVIVGIPQLQFGQNSVLAKGIPILELFKGFNRLTVISVVIGLHSLFGKLSG